MDRFDVIKNCVRYIVSELRPTHIYLYGSLAYGDYNKYSDIDFLILCDSPERIPFVNSSIKTFGFLYKIDLLSFDNFALDHDLNIYSLVYSEKKEYRVCLDVFRFNQFFVLYSSYPDDVASVSGRMNILFHYFTRCLNAYCHLHDYFAFDRIRFFLEKNNLEPYFYEKIRSFLDNLLEYEYFMYSRDDFRPNYEFFMDFFKRSISIFESFISDFYGISDVKDYLMHSQKPDATMRHFLGQTLGVSDAKI